MSAFGQAVIVALIGLWAAAAAARRLLPGPWQRALTSLASRVDGPRRPRWMQRLAMKLRVIPAASGCGNPASGCGSCSGCDTVRPTPHGIGKRPG